MKLTAKEMKDGRTLLNLFRKYQQKKNNIGCLCSDCIEDMAKAYREMTEKV